MLRPDGRGQDLLLLRQLHGLQVPRPDPEVLYYEIHKFRIINQIFADIQTLYDQQVVVRVSYMEIYNEYMYDLLSPSIVTGDPANLAIQEDERGNVFVKGLI